MMLQAALFTALRPDAGDGRTVVALRWMASAGFGLGARAYNVYRTANGVDTLIAKDLGAPGAVPDAKQNWTIDPLLLQTDADARQADGIPPLFPAGQSVASLASLLLFALTSPDLVALDAALGDVIGQLGAPHLTDDALATRFWPGQPPPDLATLQLWAKSASSAERARYQAVRRYYRRYSRMHLSAIALDFGFARFLGIGLNDVPPSGLVPDLAYRLEVAASTGTVVVNEPGPQRVRLLRPPRDVAAVPAKGRVGHPMFETFLPPKGTWAPRRGVDPATTLGIGYAKAALGRHAPGPIARASWKRAKDDTMDRFGPSMPAQWAVERHAWGPASAGTPKPLPDPGLSWEQCQPDARIVAGWPKGKPDAETIFFDDPDPAYGTPAMLGWYGYRARAIDMFGIPGQPSDPFVGNGDALVHLDDDEPPLPPRLLVNLAKITLADGAPSTVVPVSIDWSDVQEFVAPDARYFRVTASWRALLMQAVDIGAHHAAPSPLSGVYTDVQLQDPVTGATLSFDDLAPYHGARIYTARLSFQILTLPPENGYSLRILTNGQSIGAGQAALRRIPLPPVATEDIIVNRKPARPVATNVVSVDPLLLTLTERDGGGPIPAEPGLLYVHLFGGSLTLKPDGAGRFTLLASDDTSGEAAAMLAEWRALPLDQARQDLAASPGLMLPQHAFDWSLNVPPSFEAGVVDLRVSAIDSAAYRWPPGALGNEGVASAPVTLAVVSDAIPTAAPPTRHIWAKDAAPYAEHATVDLNWDAIPGAARYEIERIFESRLGLGQHAGEKDLVAAAATAPAKAFDRRTNAARSPRWTDDLPGRAPARAIYRMRGISASEVAGPWGGYTIVAIPDTRIPAMPNLLSVKAGDIDRTLDACWTQAGPLDGIGFEIEARRVVVGQGDEDGWKTIANVLPGRATSGAGGRLSTTLPNLVPGQRMEVRLIAVRHALDPIDPNMIAERAIRGPASLARPATPRGDLRPPTSLTARQERGKLRLRWRNDDDYQTLELQIRRPDGVGFARQPLAGLLETILVPLPTDPGLWGYRLQATGEGRSCVSDTIEQEI